ncbi:MAG: MarC family protein [Campylobacterota bacterium]|nr:MarC family protein [Campylobacterota bacterium]
MGNFLELFLQQSITFFAILDPIGVSALMLSLMHSSVTKSQMNKVAYRATITIIVAFFVVLIGGTFILQLFGINENSLKVMGGIVLILMAINMVQGSKQSKKPSKEEDEEHKEQEDLSVIPIGIPITFGPGIFTTIIIYKQQAQSFSELLAIILAFFLNALIIYLTFKNSIYIKQFLGLTGQNIITKLMGLIVGAIAVQFIVSGTIQLAKLYL